ncbi:MAG TPA: SPW repeat protein [Stellaceae bacterium]
MATRQFDRPPDRDRANRWQDWTNLALGIWLFLSPWILRFDAGVPQGDAGAAAAASNASWDAWVCGIVIALVALSAISRMEFWQEWINMLLGAWVFIAPWVLGFSSPNLVHAAWDHWIVGAVVFIVSAWSLSDTRRAPRAVDYASAGDKPRRDL